MYDDLFSLTLCKKLLKTFKKNCFNSHDGWEKTLYLGIAAEGYRQNTEPSRCIFQISLKYIELVIPKILFILVLCRFNFYFKIMLTSPPPLPQQNYIDSCPNNITPPTKIKISDPPSKKTFLKFGDEGGSGEGGGGGWMPWNLQNGLIFLTWFFAQQFTIIIETSWTNFHYWWVLGNFAGVSWSQTCYNRI